jgi:cytochrome c5
MRIFAAALVALPPAGITAASLPDPESPGAKKVAEVCSGCHNIPSPTAHSATDWPSVARRMWLRIDLLPRDLTVSSPSMADRQIMLKYLLDHSLKVSNANLPEGAGREAFVETCGRCHALPDPRQHSAADWPTVVLRMGERMDQMKVTRAPQQQTQELVQYLQRVSTRKS